MEYFNHSLTPGACVRFWSKIDIRDEDECWPWTAAVGSRGYGKFSWRVGRGVCHTVNAHRLMLQMKEGPFPAHLVVRHTCDNPICVNPAHLLLGTALDNAHDKVERQRQACGEENGRAMIDESVVVEIRRRAAAGESICALAQDIGLGESATLAAVRGLTWKHVPGAVPFTRHYQPPTLAMGAEARRRVWAGESLGAVARALGVDRSTLKNIVRGNYKKWAGPIEGVPPVPAKRTTSKNN